MSQVMNVLKNCQYRLVKGGVEPTVHELAKMFYKSLGADAADIKKWSDMYVEAVEHTVTRSLPRSDRTIPSQKHRIELLKTEEGLLAKAKEMADAMFQELVRDMMKKVVNGKVISSFDDSGLTDKGDE